MEQELNKKDFFISYNHKDEDAARWIAWQLEKEGFTTIIQAWDFLPGNNFVEKMDNALKACKSTIAVLSHNYLNSGFTKAEWQAAFAKDPTGEKRSLIPIRIQSCDLEGLLGQIIYIDLVGLKEEEAKKKLLESVRSTRLKPGEPPPFKGFETRHVSGLNRDEILKKRKTELKELLEKTIKHNYHMTLKLEQEIEKEIEIKDEETGKIEKRKELIWEAVGLEKILEDKNNYILINPSGMGKTTFLTYIAWNLLESNKDYELFPFLTTCIELNKRQSTIYNFIKSNLESFYYNSKTSLIENEWKNVCILIDALDQARDVDDIASSLHLQNMYSNYKKAKVIISSRQNTAGKIKEGFNIIRLKFPGDDEVQHYLGEKHYSNLKLLIDSSRDLITVPVLLEMLKIISERGNISSNIYNRTSLFDEFTRVLIAQERNKPRYWQNPSIINNFINYELEQSLEKIAFFSLANNEILEIGKDKLIKYCETPEKKDTFLNIGIILELFEDKELKIVFRHQSFQAYFAARYIYYQQPQYFEQLTSDIVFFYNDVWYEVLRFYIGLEKDRHKAEKMINKIYKRNFLVHPIKSIIAFLFEKPDLNYSIKLIFAFFLMSETQISSDKIHEFYDHLGNLLKNNEGYLEFIKLNIDKFDKSNIDQKEKINIIFEHLIKDDHSEIRRAAAELFGKIGSPKDIPLIKPLLLNDFFSTNVQIAAVEALGEINTSKAIPLLEPLLRNGNKLLRSVTAEALGKILISKKEISQLKLLIFNSEWILRRAAAKTLGNLGTSKEISLLKPLLNDVFSNVRSVAAEALGKIVTTKEISQLESFLKDDNWRVREATAKALGEMGNSKVIVLLEPLLKDDNWRVREAAAKALGKVGSSKDIPLLKPLLGDNNWYARETAAEAFGKIGSSQEIPILKTLLRDDNLRVREAAAKALGEIGAPKVIPLLVPLLKDDNWSIRDAATKALGKVGSSKDIPLLKPLLRDSNQWVRRAAAEALGKIGTPIDIPLLGPLLKDSNKWVRKAAVEAFGKIGDSIDTPCLKLLLRDHEKAVRRVATEALGKIGTPKDIPLLESLLRDKWVRKMATEAIENIYKRMNPKLKIIEAIPRTKEK